MKFSILALATAVCCTPVRQPLSISFTVERNVLALAKRSVSSDMDNRNDLSYSAKIVLGANKQLQRVTIDTGSADLWVLGPSYAKDNNGNGYYDPLTSLLSRDTGDLFSIHYLSGKSDKGEYYTDKFAFVDAPNVVLSQFRFASVSNAGDSRGFLGIGDKADEEGKKEYNNLPYALAAQGIISKASYSLYLNKAGAEGTILFGAVDEAKLAGPLVKYPKAEVKSSVVLQTIELDGQNITAGQAYDFDSGSLYCHFPQEIVDYFDKVFNPTIKTSSSGKETRYVDCNQPKDKYVTFDFGRNSVLISYYDFVTHFDDGECVLGTEPSPRTILADNFLRSAYMYYDYTDQQIGIAPVRYTLESRIVSD